MAIDKQNDPCAHIEVLLNDRGRPGAVGKRAFYFIRQILAIRCWPIAWHTAVT